MNERLEVLMKEFRKERDGIIILELLVDVMDRIPDILKPDPVKIEFFLFLKKIISFELFDPYFLMSESLH